MTQKLSPAELRQRAKDILAQADKLEEQQMVRIGRLTVKHYEEGFKTFDTEKFKKEIEEVLS